MKIMKTFRLTIKRLDSSDEFLELSNKIMHHLYKDFDLRDEPGFCNETLMGLLGGDLKDLALLVSSNDWPNTIKTLGNLKLVGSEYGLNDEVCPECGSPDWFYTGGRMLCNQCEFSEPAPEGYYDGDIADYSGKIVL